MSGVAPYLRLIRVGTLFSPATDVIAGACLGGLPWSTAVVRAAIASVCLYGAGMILNDHADRDEDARQRPERPIPRGDVAPTTALVLGVTLMAVAVATSPLPLYHGVMAALVLGYDYLLKRSAGAGIVTMASLRAMNLAGGTIVVLGGVPADPASRDALFAVAGCYGLYIAAVTALGILEDRPAPPRAVVGVQAVPPLVVVLGVLALPVRWPAAAIAIALALAFSLRVRRRGSDWDQQAIRGSMTWLLLGTMLYTSLVALGSGRWPEAVGIALAVVPARWISRRIALT